MKNVILMLAFAVLFSTTQVRAEDVDYEALGKQGIKAYRNGDLMGGMDKIRRSAEHGYAPAQSVLGYLLDKSDADSEAFKWYLKAAEQGDADGQYGVARLYANGEGVEKDEALAREWMFKAVEKKQPDALRLYAGALEAGTLGIARDVGKALSIYQRCHEDGDMTCSSRLIRAYERGEMGLPVDKKKVQQVTHEMFGRGEKKDRENLDSKK